MAKDSKEITQSLSLVDFGSGSEGEALRKLVVNDCSAQYGDLKIEKRLTFSSSVNKKSVSFGEKESGRVKTSLTPALHLLAICVQIDALLLTPCNEGMRIPQIPVDDMPTTVCKWISERREFLRKQAIVNAPAVSA
jgi:hypothetical protein